MIAVALQLGVFLLLALNYGLGGQDASIRLPSSELARPTAARLDAVVSLQVTSQGMVAIDGKTVATAQVEPLLAAQREALKKQGSTPGEATVIVRADRDAPTGRVQELVEIAQKLGYEKFILRTLDDQGKTSP